MGIASKLGNNNMAGASAPPMPGGGALPGASQASAQGGGGAPAGYPQIGGQPQGQAARPGSYPSTAPQPGQYGAPGATQPGQYGAPGSQQGGQYGMLPSSQSSQYPQMGAQGARPQQGQYGAPSGQYGAPAGLFGGPQGSYPGQSQPQGQMPGQFGSQAQYGGQSQGQFGQTGGQMGVQGQYGTQARPQGQFPGMPGQQGQQGFGGAAFPQHVIRQKLQTLITENRLQAFYPPQKLEQVVAYVASKDVAGLGQRWRLPNEITLDLIALSLYDICIYVDDSGSMLFEENGERIDDLKSILSRTAEAACLFDTDGIVVRFMNSNVEGNGIHSEAEATALIQQIRFSGTTPLGSSLDRKVLQPMVLGEARRNNMQKPVLVICITDGEPTGEPKETVRQVVINAKNQLSNTPYGAGAVAFQFAQVGKDGAAHRFLEALDTDPVCGNMIDSTSYFELEQEQYARKGITLEPSVYLVKLMCGAIDRSYDEMDEG